MINFIFSMLINIHSCIGASSDDVKTESFKTKIERSPSNFVSSTA